MQICGKANPHLPEIPFGKGMLERENNKSLSHFNDMKKAFSETKSVLDEIPFDKGIWD